MSDIANLGQRVEAARHALCEIEQQYRKSSEDLTDVLREVAETVNRKQAELIEHQAQYQHILDEYVRLKDLLHSLVLNSETDHHSYLSDTIGDLDVPVGDSESTRSVGGQLANRAAANVENFEAAEADHVRLGVHRMLKKASRNGAPN